MKIFRKLAAGALVLGAVLSMSAPASNAADSRGSGGCGEWRVVCVWEHSHFHGATMMSSGYAHYTALPSWLRHEVSSWANTNKETTMYLGHWLGNMPRKGSYLPPGWKGDNLIDDSYNDRAEFIARSDWHW